jgi:hypothetical protein
MKSPNSLKPTGRTRQLGNLHFELLITNVGLKG